MTPYTESTISVHPSSDGSIVAKDRVTGKTIAFDYEEVRGMSRPEVRTYAAAQPMHVWG